jgi:hypothetical protein
VSEREKKDNDNGQERKIVTEKERERVIDREGGE